MSKAVTHENYRVVIEPRRLGDFGGISFSDSFVSKSEADMQRQYRERCLEIAADVRRRVEGVGSVQIEFDTVSTCSHCGYAWTEESDTYNGGCCDADELSNPTGEAS